MVGCLLGVAFFSGLLLLKHPKTQGVRESVESMPFKRQKPSDDEKLTALVASTFADQEGAYAIVVEDLAADRRASMQDDRVMQTASLYKLFTMAALFDAAKKSGEEMSDETKEAIERMITISSNEDGTFLSSTYGWENITTWAHDHDFSDTNLSEIPPVTSARDIAKFFRLLWKGELVSKEASEEMLRILFDQRLNDRIPKYLPGDVRIAHKTGRIDGWLHDAGIVVASRSAYVIVLMAEDLQDVDAGKERMALFSKDVLDIFEKRL
ncbi:MAG: serine hydrolase [bacterium]|nr:serine hydrolase [bacterium]